LPDLGEELAMTRLNSIAVAIKNVYEPGALVNIASDGILFNGQSHLVFSNEDYLC
jgi:pyoverdine/dityrosine biosynthesis protein Dit1